MSAISQLPIEWPQRRRVLEARAGYAAPAVDLLNLDYVRTQYKSEIALATTVIARGQRDGADPKTLVGTLGAIEPLSSILGRSTSDWGAIVGLGVVNVLRRRPSLKTWEALWLLAWHSAVLEHRLPEVVAACAKEGGRFKSIVVDLAFKVAKVIDASPGRRAIPREKPMAEALRDAWLANGSLTDLWWGLREGGYLRFHDDDGMFRIIADVDLRLFVRLLASFKNPYPVRAALEAAGVNWSFDRWESLIKLAPSAFKADGSWNGSVIVPLLLSCCWHSATAERVRRDSNDLAKVTEEIHVLVDRIAEAIATRQDAGPCAERWATWLVRQGLAGLANEAQPFPADAASRGYVEFMLVSSLGKQIREHKWNEKSPADAELWEPWCYRALLIIYASTNISKMPTADAFIEEWALSPEEWADTKGHQLREKASIFETFGKRPDAYGSRLLALPLVSDGNVIANWESLWGATPAIRETVEFGSADEGNLGAISLQISGGQLLRLEFGIGLMMLDIVADPKWNINIDRQDVLNNLFSHLSATAFDMRAVDHFDQGYWDIAVKHLAVRRLLWATQTDAVAAHFSDATTPTFIDFLADAQKEVENLIALIEGCLRNGVAQTSILEELAKANIDLGTQIALAERLRELDMRRSGIPDEQLQAVRSLVASSSGGVIPNRLA